MGIDSAMLFASGLITGACLVGLVCAWRVYRRTWREIERASWWE